MKTFSKLLFVATMLSGTMAQATDWSFRNCHASLLSFPAKNQNDVIVSLQFSDVTGVGSGVAMINGEDLVGMSCQFLTEMRYGLFGVPKNQEWIICETEVPVLNGLKFGVPFNVVQENMRRTINPVTYIQFEDGNVGHGTLDGFSCLEK